MRAIKRPAFLRDLSRYALHIAKNNPDAALRLIDAAEATCNLLIGQPGLGHAEKFRKVVGVRSFRIKDFDKYLVFYRTSEDSIEFIRLIHGARDLPAQFNR
jgi:toxin ParE1/3/4